MLKKVYIFIMVTAISVNAYSGSIASVGKMFDQVNSLIAERKQRCPNFRAPDVFDEMTYPQMFLKRMAASCSEADLKNILNAYRCATEGCEDSPARLKAVCGISGEYILSASSKCNHAFKSIDLGDHEL